LIPANGSSETIFTLVGSGATATAYTNSAGQVSQVVVTAGGSGYYVPPTLIFPGAPVTTHLQTGTVTGLVAANNTSNVELAFSGATGLPTVLNGQVVGVQITNLGTGYIPNSTFPVTFGGGNTISPGMAVAVNKTSAANAGYGIGNVRVAGPNQIAITAFNNTAANITPPANDTFQIVAFNEMPELSPVIQVVATLANCTAAAANTSNQTSVTVNGILATDAILNASPTALQSPLIFGSGYTAANTINFQYAGGVPGGTPANGTYTFNIMRPSGAPPIQVLPVLITPAAVANNTTAEQVFALPANLTLAAANTTTFVNKPSFTPGIGIVGARANSTTTIGITFQNNTANSITPPAEVYLVVNATSPVVALTANQTAGVVSTPARASYNYLIDLVNEQQHVSVQLGCMRGY
jgi:hypothetical protein